MQLPTSQEFHEEVQGIKPKRDRIFLETLYLTAGRQREVVRDVEADGPILIPSYQCLTCDSVISERKRKKHKHDRFSEEPVRIREVPAIRGLRAKDVTTRIFRNEYPLLELYVRTAKRRTEPYYRHIGVPLDPKLEPLSQEILEYAQQIKRKKRYLFPFSRRWGWVLVKKHMPWIYNLDRKRLNPWRHVRLTHLSYEYYFRHDQLKSYSGHTQGMGALKEYVTAHWKQYIHIFFGLPETIPAIQPLVAQIP